LGDDLPPISWGDMAATKAEAEVQKSLPRFQVCSSQFADSQQFAVYTVVSSLPRTEDLDLAASFFTSGVPCRESKDLHVSSTDRLRLDS
jgi:hypothetical protein